MRHSVLAAAAALAFVAQSAAFADAKIGEAAPSFNLMDASGKTRSLDEFKGKTVVLEWNNPECPFVRKHYNAEVRNMQTQQANATKDGVVWLTINSGAPGKQGHLDGSGAKEVIASTGAKQTAYLLDPSGDAGRAYGAKTTPHMFVIDSKGIVQYAGGIDSIPSADVDDISKATQYVPQALADLKAGTAVRVTTSVPYGCSVKY
ncbi:MAG TPA: redoxin family protein [Steroidobacteraceae bacterium]|nr:redoxin family protein [Steroidobacteraceae bacterium]